MGKMQQQKAIIKRTKKKKKRGVYTATIRGNKETMKCGDQK
jgi:hypothetical protein